MADLKEYVELFEKLKGGEVVVPQSREEAFRLAFLNAMNSGSGGSGGASDELLKGLIERSLIEITIPDGATGIGSHAFYKCEKLTAVIIPDTVTEIGNFAFGYSGVTSIEIPSSVKKIGMYCFANGQAGNYLQSIVFNEGLETIMDAAFRYNSCENIELPKSVSSIGASTFCDAIKLKSFIIPENCALTVIPSYMLSACPLLETVAIPEGITEISQYAFNDCVGLTTIALPSTINTIDSSAFSGCTNLTINVPWAEGAVANAPWGATNATINYNYTE